MTRPRIRPLGERENIVSIEDFAEVLPPIPGFGVWLEKLPEIYGARDLKELVRVWKNTVSTKGMVGLALGAHVFKVGLAPILIDLMRRGFVGHIATNGAGAIHDYEFALIGESSEDVAEGLVDGSFGFWKETFDGMREATMDGEGDGMGRALGRLIHDNALPHREVSIFSEAFRLGIPITVHVAIGCDIVHMDPDLDGAALGKASLEDFRILCESVQKLDNGLWLNVGSAVIMPEVFLKAVSLARNLGRLSEEFTTANLDMIQHYRAVVNVVRRPSRTGLSITAQHEIILPLIHQALISE